MKAATYISITFIASLLLGCGTHETHELTQLPPLQVKVAGVTTIPETSFVSASGKIEAQQSASLSTRLMGHITHLHVKAGDKVRQGQELVSISNTDLMAQKAQAEASIAQAASALKNAEKDYQRFKTLFEKESASEKELDDMTTRYEMAKANLDAAEQMKKGIESQFAYTSVVAPFSGVVINTFIKAGDMANPGMPLVAVEGTQNYQAVVTVSETDISRIETNGKAKVLIKSIGKELTGKVVEVSPSATNTGGQYQLKIDLEDAGTEVLSGMFVNAQFRAKASMDQPGRVFVPAEALVKRGQLKGIYVVTDDQTAILRWLRTGRTLDEQVEVTSGLKPNENYIISSEGKLYNGAKVSY